MKHRWPLFAVLFSLLAPHGSMAQDFYRGKVIRVIVGGSAGGGFDIYTRAMARHMGKHIPGNPSLVVENMTGAGTLIAAKYVHSSAKPDGLSIGMFNGGLILGRVLGMKGIDFDMRELEYLGVPVQDNPVCALRKESGVTKDADQVGRLESRQQHQRCRADHSKRAQPAGAIGRRLQGHQ
jgi:tripartite-type tricarboxylate transporter receptor subunit TctC